MERRRPMRTKNTDKLNAKRLKIMAKGYIKRSESGEYIGVCQKIGRKQYDTLKHSLEDKGIIVSPFGISVDEFNNFIGISKDEIIKYAELGY